MCINIIYTCHCSSLHSISFSMPPSPTILFPMKKALFRPISSGNSGKCCHEKRLGPAHIIIRYPKPFPCYSVNRIRNHMDMTVGIIALASPVAPPEVLISFKKEITGYSIRHHTCLLFGNIHIPKAYNGMLYQLPVCLIIYILHCLKCILDTIRYTSFRNQKAAS